MHTNTPGGYSITSYTSGGQYERNAEQVTVKPGQSTDNFFFVTKQQDYTSLSQRYNAVLQSQTPTDDGSLSVASANLNVRYINVEARDNDISGQSEMLDAIQPLINQ